MTCECIPVEKWALPLAWPHVEKFIQDSLDVSHGEIALQDVYSDLSNDVGKLCVIVDKEEGLIAAFVMELREFRRKKVCFVPYIGGKSLDKWCDKMLDLAEKVARAEGASAVYGAGRRGWARRLASSGYSEYSVIVGKEL